MCGASHVQTSEQTRVGRDPRSNVSLDGCSQATIEPLVADEKLIKQLNEETDQARAQCQVRCFDPRVTDRVHGS